MARKPRPEELRLWGLVTSTVRPRTTPMEPAKIPMAPMLLDPSIVPRKSPPKHGPLEPIEPNRRRRIVVQAGRDPLPKLDLHGMDQREARRALAGFIGRAFQDHERAVLVVTGKGVQGDGVLRKALPAWLAEPELRPMVAGFSLADPHHGGSGAVYVALKRRVHP